jgi:hypothetical protein
MSSVRSFHPIAKIIHKSVRMHKICASSWQALIAGPIKHWRRGTPREHVLGEPGERGHSCRRHVYIGRRFLSFRTSGSKLLARRCGQRPETSRRRAARGIPFVTIKQPGFEPPADEFGFEPLKRGDGRC